MRGTRGSAPGRFGLTGTMPSWHLPTTGRIGAAELLLAHIPGAVFYMTQRGLSAMGAFVMMGVVGLIVASLLNLSLHSSGLQFGISVGSIGARRKTSAPAPMSSSMARMRRKGERHAQDIALGSDKVCAAASPRGGRRVRPERDRSGQRGFSKRNSPSSARTTWWSEMDSNRDISRRTA